MFVVTGRGEIKLSDERWIIPNSWQWVYAGDIADVIGGGTPSTRDLNNFQESGDGIPWLTPADLSNYDATYISRGARDISEKGLTSSSAKLMPKATVLFSSRAPIGYCVIALNEISTNQGFKSLSLYQNISPELIRFYLLISKRYAESFASGSTFKELSGKKVAQLKIPLPPLNEQKRIVTKIEALQTRSTAVKEELEVIKPLLDQFRQSVLAAAFRGDLTKDWREQNPDVEPAEVLLERIRVERRRRWEEAELEKMKAKGKVPKDDKWKKKYKEPEPIDTESLPELPYGWCWVNLEELSEIELGKMLDRGKEQKGKLIPYLRNINVRWDSFDLDDLLTMDFENHELERFGLKKGDILVCEGGEPGRCAVWELENSEIKYQKTLHRLRPFLDFSRYWIVYHLKLDAVQGTISNYCSGSTIKHLTKVLFQKYPIRLTNFEEQKEIVRRIESLFKLADNIEQQYQQAELDLETLNQSILAKAFRGELVPQDPNDEPASVLLERIKEERDRAKPKETKKKKSSKKKDKQLDIPGI